MGPEEQLEANILSKLKDLEKKIREKEPTPEEQPSESNTRLSLLVDIDDHLEEALHNWYY